MALTPISELFNDRYTIPTGKRSSGSNADSLFFVPMDTTPAQPSNVEPGTSSSEAPAASRPVTFDPSAQAFAQLAAKGITALTLHSNPLGPQIAGSSEPAAARPLVSLDRGVSKAEFEKLVTDFGGSKAQADQLFATFDADGDGSISHSEFLAGLAKTDTDGGSASFAQSLGQLMDQHGNHDGKVDNMEFGDFEAAFVQAEAAAATETGDGPSPVSSLYT
ncbi:hypothetical protein [Paraburkholderia sp. 2C]|jgi:EF hand domain-containing protein